MKKRFLWTAVLLMALCIACCVLLPRDAQAATYGNLQYKIENGQVTITGCTQPASGELLIPDTIEGYPVTSIGRRAFSACRNLSSVSIPDSVISIGRAAFEDCTSLTSVILGENSQLTSIGEGTFWDCSSLTSITIPDSVTSIGEQAFRDCSSLTYVTIPASITQIGRLAFGYCTSLVGITIPDGVAEIAKSTFAHCSRLTSITIPDSVISIGDFAFSDCSNLTDVYYTGSEEQWGAFSLGFDNKSLTNATVHYNYNGGRASQSIRLFSQWDADNQIAYFEDYNFFGCKVTEKTDTSFLANVEKLIGKYVWVESEPLGDGMVGSDILLSIKEVETRTGTVSQADSATITIDGVTYATPESVVFPDFFEGEKVIYFISNGELLGLKSHDGSIPENPGDDNPPDDNEDSEDDKQPDDGDKENEPSAGKLVVYSDYTNLSISTGSTITLSTGIQINGEVSGDPSGITFQVGDTSILKVIDTGISGNCRYVKLKGIQNGTATVAFTDATTGKTVTMPVTVCDNYYHSYALSNVPVQHIEKYPTNFYNVNGLFVDSYDYKVNDNGSATVTFDVYNTNYTYGTVEVFDQNGNLVQVVLIDKMTSSNTSIKEAVWDNMGYLIRDFFDGDFLTYRQESGYSVRTPVNVEIPENGYLRICTDPEESFVVGLVNAADIIMQFNEIAGKVQGFSANSKEFAEKLTKNLLADKVYMQYLKDGSSFPKKLMKNVTKDAVTTSVSLRNFTETIANNLVSLNLTEIIISTGTSMGISIAEKVFTDLSGWIGDVLEILFVIGKAENVLIQHSDYAKAQGNGSIYIQNQGGGIRASQ